ncbi:ABC transporter ATP-binding protein [Dactylosporangium sp. NPDC000244]|uniref:ABC transporter ATP-binding protein n=1 Tax=Dactylosporangium sp. NPDC000244 TaxID=3154365 RepID=UPI00332E6BE2
MTEFARNIAAILSSARQASPSRLAVSLVLMILGAVSGPLIALTLKQMIDASIDHRVAWAVGASVVFAFIALAHLTMEHFAHIFFFELCDLHAIRVESELGQLALGTPGIEQHELSDFADRMELLRKESGSIGEAVQAVLTAIALAVQIVLTAVLLAYLQPFLLLLPLAAIPPVIAGRMAEQRRQRAELAAAEQERLSTHLLELAVRPAAAKEIRIFGLQDELRSRRAGLRRDIHARLRKAETTGMVLRILGQLVFAAGYVGAVVLVVREAIAGRRSTGDVIMAVALAVQTSAQTANALKLAQDLQRHSRTVQWVSWLHERVAKLQPPPADLPAPDRLEQGIVFDEVSFRYPGSDRDALSHVNLRIAPGTTVAIVGDNGAGKSTLTKLLCRFYRPSGGAITVDGADLSRIDPQAWLSRIAANFQDHVRFELAAGQVVGLGDLPRSDDEEAVRRALHRADATGVVDGLPDGLATQLGKSYADGAELSGGQWQRLALGRAMMREAPLLLLLDEPASALDPQAEHALFERYAESAKQAAAVNGGVCVLVSHRFSTVRMADLIVVLDSGGVVEQGSHDELMRRGGLYAELFELQASVYR